MASYRRIFDPPLVLDKGQSTASGNYVYTERSVLVVNAALVTGRPVLIRGSSGTGKSSLAFDVAEVLGWRFVSEVITSATRADDLKWRVDYVERLAMAQGGERDPGRLALRNFVSPGPLWRGFDPDGAAKFGGPAPGVGNRAVVLLDEIDKADPDLPNGLLEPLEEGRFRVPPADDLEVSKHRMGAAGEEEATAGEDRLRTPLVFATTNEERRLPDAFLRRCLELRLEYPRRDRMAAIARVHRLDDVFEAVWTALFGESKEMTIGPAEFLDTARAYKSLGGGADLLNALQEVTAWKHGRHRPGRGGPSGLD